MVFCDKTIWSLQANLLSTIALLRKVNEMFLIKSDDMNEILPS